jgi:hypothetical protein
MMLNQEEANWKILPTSFAWVSANTIELMVLINLFPSA